MAHHAIISGSTVANSPGLTGRKTHLAPLDESHGRTFMAQGSAIGAAAPAQLIMGANPVSLKWLWVWGARACALSV
jgi:hypothetical protein